MTRYTLADDITVFVGHDCLTLIVDGVQLRVDRRALRKQKRKEIEQARIEAASAWPNLPKTETARQTRRALAGLPPIVPKPAKSAKKTPPQPGRRMAATDNEEMT